MGKICKTESSILKLYQQQKDFIMERLEGGGMPSKIIYNATLKGSMTGGRNAA